MDSIWKFHHSIYNFPILCGIHVESIWKENCKMAETSPKKNDMEWMESMWNPLEFDRFHVDSMRNVGAQ
jgi:hypothetical protein